MKYPKSVEEFFTRESKWKPELAQLRMILLSTGMKEKLKWGFPCYIFENKNVVGLGAFKSYFGIWFFQGGLLKDDHGKLMNAQEGKTKALRQWRMSSQKEIDENLILSYIQEAIENQKAGKEIKAARPSKKPVVVSGLLKDALDADKQFHKAFFALTLGKQREYAVYINSAKRESTQRIRLEKIIPMIMDGAGLNDRYKSKRN